MPDASATIPVLAPTGDLDLATSRGLGTQIAELAGTPGSAVLDLSGIAFIDSVGLGVVLKGAERFRRQGKLLVFVVPPEGNVARLLQFAGVRDRLVVEATRDAAVGRAQRD